MQNQGVITREQMVNHLTYQRQELESCLEKALAIEVEINELEDKLYSKGESLDNFRACHNQPVFAKKRCELCVFYKRCVYRGKGDYGRFKL